MRTPGLLTRLPCERAGNRLSTARSISYDNQLAIRLLRRLRGAAPPLGYLAGGDEFPERDEQFAGQGDNHRLAGGAARVSSACSIPLCQCAVLLEHQETPGELQHAVADPGIARPGQALFSPTGTAFLGRAGQSAVTRHPRRSRSCRESTS